MDITEISPKDKRMLIALARNAVEWFSKYGEKYSPSEFELTDSMYSHAGVFVSIFKNGELRGCIGYTEPIKEIWNSIIDNAINAAFYDPRFPTIKGFEIPHLTYEVSILGDKKRLVWN